MKKHIQKKFLHETELTQEIMESLKSSNNGIPLVEV